MMSRVSILINLGLGQLCCYRSKLIALSALSMLLFGSGCQPRITTHGFMPRTDLIERLQLGEQSKNEIAVLLGSPTIIGTFDQDIWYYVTQTTENKFFFKPEIIDQEILALTFNEAGVLVSLEEKSMLDAIRIEPNAQQTPTVGRKLSLLQQLFGNFGRFSNSPGTTP
ncbi:MAG: hypothetical protein CMM32_01270 [Rhodospirillaceae bacterium]|nr:hypothetical protein [Rhodospirillaceae bacterium]